MAKTPRAYKTRGPSPPRLLTALLLLSATPTISSQPTTTTTPSIATAPLALRSSSSPEFTAETAFASAILHSTNVYRAAHNASDVRWNTTLASFAVAYLASAAVGVGCAFAHSGGPYGENLALGFANASAAVAAWGDEGRSYDYARPAFAEATGHFTQLVWKATAAVGCGRRLCDGKGWYLVCEYWPRGNIIGAFRDQVGRPVDSAAGAGRAACRGCFAAAGVALWMVMLL
ncbi:CAP domain-containing protein [Ustulina deusta]|nr:CAP domain-containing protein [Ustulina deusta]